MSPYPDHFPNLDYKIVVGNSLVSKLKIGESEEIIEIDWEVKAASDSTKNLKESIRKSLDKLFDKQKVYFSYEGDKHDLQNEIQKLKIEVLLKQLELSMHKYKEKNTSQGAFFSLTAKDKVKRVEYENKITGFENAIMKLEKLKVKTDIPLQFFDWKLNFPDVMNEQVTSNIGFDIVIANPPYLKEKR